MNVEIRTEASQFLFWEYLFRIYGIVSLQCVFFRHECIKLHRADCFHDISVILVCLFKGSLTRDFRSHFFFHESVSPRPLINTLGSFRLFSKIRRDNRE
jgi:hypothetical protein